MTFKNIMIMKKIIMKKKMTKGQMKLILIPKNPILPQMKIFLQVQL